MPDKSCSTGKTKFASVFHAERALDRITSNPDPERLYVPTGYLRCRCCGGFHLTSSWAKPHAKGKRRHGPNRRTRS